LPLGLLVQALEQAFSVAASRLHEIVWVHDLSNAESTLWVFHE
jgi:hypothetical protein